MTTSKRKKEKGPKPLCDELSDPNSCLNKAKDDEILFVLLGRDPAFAATVLFWAGERVRLGCNNALDEKVRRALALADEAEAARAMAGA